MLDEGALRKFKEFFLAHNQFGIGVPGGLEAMIHLIQSRDAPAMAACWLQTRHWLHAAAKLAGQRLARSWARRLQHARNAPRR